MTSPSPARRARPAAAFAVAIACVLCATSVLAQASLATQAPAARPAAPTASIRAASALPSPVAAPLPARPGQPSVPARAPASPDEVFAAWDKDNSRSLSLVEFRAGMEQLKQSSMVARLGGLFRTVDANRNSKLEASEYANLPLIKRAGKDAPPLSTFDINKDGALDNQEYLRMVEALIRTAETQGG